MATSSSPRLSEERRVAGWRAHCAALAAALLAVGIRWALSPLIGSEAGRYHTLLFALVAVGWKFGLGASFSTLAAGGLAAWYVLVPPAFSWNPGNAIWGPGLAFYLMSGIAVAWLGDYLARLQRRAALALLAVQEGDATLSSIFSASNVAIAQTDPSTRRFLRVNPKMCELTGYCEDELLQMTVDELNYADDRALDRDVFERMRRGEQHYELEKRYLRKDGTPVWASVAGGLVRDAEGRARIAFGVAQDITRRKEAEEALLESVSLLRAVCDHTAAPIFVKDRDCRMLLANPATLAVFGRSLDEVLGSDLREFIPLAAEAEAMLENDRRIMATGVAEMVEESYTTPDGERIYQATKSPLRDERGRVIGLIGVSRDVTEQKRAEVELRQSVADARLLQSIGAELILRDDVAAVFSRVVAGAQQLMAARSASLYVLNEPSDPQQGIRLLAKCGGDEPPLACWDCVDEQGLAPACAAALTTRQRVVMPDVQLCDATLAEGRNECLEAGIRSCQTTPLLSRGGELLGLLSTYWERPYEPGERALRNLDLLARQAADLIERTQAEQALRASEERQKFLLELSDLLRPLADPVEIQRQAACAVGRHLQTHRVGYAEDQGDGGTLVVCPNYVDGVPPLEGRICYADFGLALREELQTGRTVVRVDPAADERLTSAEKAAHEQVQLGAAINVPLVKDGRLIAVMFAHHRTARSWTAEEIQLMEQAAERTWAAVERARAEAAVRASELKYRMLFDSIDEGYLLAEILFDAAGCAVDALFYDANPAAERHTGVDLVGKRLSEVDPQFKSHWRETLGRVVQTGAAERGEYYSELFRKWLSYYVFRIGGAGSRRVAGIFHDVTERKNAEQRLRSALVAARMASWYWNTSTDRLDATDTLNELLGAPQTEPIESCAEFFSRVHPADLDAYQAAVEAAVAQGSGWRAEFRIQRPFDGSVSWLEERAEPQIDRASGRVDYTGLVWDVTRGKLQEQAVQEASRRKDEFLATLAHELRNPLAPICNSLQLLRMSNIEPETRGQVLDMLDRQATHMVRLVDELMEVSRITRGAITLRRELIDLAQVAATAVEAAAPAIQAASHRLTVNAPSGAAAVDGDPIRLAQVITNLLDNAAKYTSQGGSIELNVRSEDRQAVIEVSDTGIGIAPDNLSRVFEVFARIDQETGDSQRGLGIGLALVKNIVELHGGNVTAHSRGRGTGSQFVVRLPLAAAGATVSSQQPASIATRETPLAGWNVLAVDDNRDAADSLTLLLETLGAAVRTAYSGPEALQAVAAEPPAVVFLDLGMPGMDGYAVAQAMRRDPRCRGVLIVALTGWGQEEDRRRTAAAGFDEHLVKPPSAAAILELLAKAREASTAR